MQRLSFDVTSFENKEPLFKKKWQKGFYASKARKSVGLLVLKTLAEKKRIYIGIEKLEAEVILKSM